MALTFKRCSQAVNTLSSLSETVRTGERCRVSIVPISSYSLWHVTKSYYERGVALAETENKYRAIADFTQAIQRNPSYVEAYFAQADAYLDVENRAGAINTYTQLIQIKPNDERAYFNRGMTRFLDRNYPDAIADYTKAIRINPKESGYYYQRGFIHSIQGDLKVAVEDYTQVIRLKPNFTRTLRAVDATLIKKRDIDAAQAFFREAIAVTEQLLTSKARSQFANLLVIQLLE